MANKRRKISKLTRTAVHLRSRFQCCYCGTDLHNCKPLTLTVEHLVPYSQGGTDDPSNLVTACFPCNRARSNKPLAQFATPGALRRIRNVRRRTLNFDLAAALLSGRTGEYAV